jgi:hypothetical protein
MKTAPALVGCISVLLLAGCASTRQFVPLPDQTKKVEDPSKGRIYVIRPATVGSAVSMNVSEMGKPVGITGPHGFLCWERPPGETIVTGTAEGVSRAPLTIVAGGVYYIFQHVRMGWLMAENQLEVIGEVEGRKVLKSCHPPKIETPPPSPVSVSKDAGHP